MNLSTGSYQFCQKQNTHQLLLLISVPASSEADGALIMLSGKCEKDVLLSPATASRSSESLPISSLPTDLELEVLGSDSSLIFSIFLNLAFLPWSLFACFRFCLVLLLPFFLLWELTSFSPVAAVLREVDDSSSVTSPEAYFPGLIMFHSRFSKIGTWIISSVFSSYSCHNDKK